MRYEIGHLLDGGSKHNHHHLICRTCNKIIPFDDDLLEEAERHIERTIGFHVLDHEVKFYGICRECMKKGNSGGVYFLKNRITENCVSYRWEDWSRSE